MFVELRLGWGEESAVRAGCPRRGDHGLRALPTRPVGVLALVVAAACGGATTPNPGDSDSGGGGGGSSIGAACSQNSDCTGVPSTDCRILGGLGGVCTTNCTTPADCGCAPGTTDKDIANGRCSAACNTSLFSPHASLVRRCVKICTSTPGKSNGDEQCSGGTACVDATDAAGTALDYKDCR